MAGFGEMLAELRQDKKLSQKDLGEILHVTPGTISNYENGVHLPDLEKLIELANFFDVTVDYLLGRCVSNLSPDRWNQPVWENRTAGEVISSIQSLTPERRQALGVVLADFMACSQEET